MIRLHSFYIVLTQSKGGGDLWERKPGRGPGRHYKSSTSPENLSLHNGRPAQVMWILLWWYQKNAAISLSGWNAFGVEEYSKSTCVVHVKQNLLKRKKLVEIAKLKSMCRKTARKKRQKREVEMRYWRKSSTSNSLINCARSIEQIGVQKKGHFRSFIIFIFWKYPKLQLVYKRSLWENST